MIGDTALDKCRDTRASFLAAGEKRRLSLALELLSDRRILLLDGVFSGLDTNESMVLMEVLKRLSRKKVTQFRRSSMWEEVFQPPLPPKTTVGQPATTIKCIQCPLPC